MNSPNKRIIISLLVNIFKAILSLATGLLIARGLGPEDFGILSFLLASFTALRSMLDMGTSSAFFSFISKKLQSKKFFITYLVWLMIQFILSLLFIGLFAPNDWIANIWQGEFRERVLLAFVAIFFQQQIWGMLSNVGESQRMTVRVQSINIFIAIFHLLIILGLYSYDALSIERIFILIIIEIFLAGIIAWWTFGITYSHE
ncbi:oligosaccharide flippase family protein, partial [archaeon]|nr:oligosaccharide flippase family protein [archaeon]